MEKKPGEKSEVDQVFIKARKFFFENRMVICSKISRFFVNVAGSLMSEVVGERSVPFGRKSD